jgi:hypothetical protein
MIRPMFTQENSGIISQLWHNGFLSNSLFTNHPIIRRYIVTALKRLANYLSQNETYESCRTTMLFYLLRVDRQELESCYHARVPDICVSSTSGGL